MAGVIQMRAAGGPEVLRWEEIEVPQPGIGDILIRQTAIGFNFIDTYHRKGLYPLPLPSGLGLEGAGIVEAVGEGVGEFRVGDAVAYAAFPVGAYAEKRLFPAAKAVKIPRGISQETAAAAMLKGMTVEYLFHRTYALEKGQTILFHAAAGGVGLIACQWAKRLGCRVIGTAGSREKAELAKEYGCDEVILYREENVAEAVMRYTGGQGVPVVYDSVGKDTFEASVASLAPRGMLVSFGQASGPVPEVNLQIFAAKALYFTRPNLFAYTSTREELEWSAQKLFQMIRKGLKIEIKQKYPLVNAAQVHLETETRNTTGSTLLIP